MRVGTRRYVRGVDTPDRRIGPRVTCVASDGAQGTSAGFDWFLSIVKERSPAVFAAKALLLAVTVLLMASMGGGFLLLPLLIPAHVWAARDSGRVGRIAWSLLPAASVGMVAWAAVYVLAGESMPAIWLVPAIALAAGWAAIVRVAGRRSLTTG